MLKRSSNLKCNENDVESLFGKGPRIPEAVFFCAIEPPTLAKEAALEQALSQLQREDPSLRVTHDTETGQIILGGKDKVGILEIKICYILSSIVQLHIGSLI